VAGHGSPEKDLAVVAVAPACPGHRPASPVLVDARDPARSKMQAVRRQHCTFSGVHAASPQGAPQVLALVALAAQLLQRRGQLGSQLVAVGLALSSAQSSASGAHGDRDISRPQRRRSHPAERPVPHGGAERHA